MQTLTPIANMNDKHSKVIDSEHANIIIERENANILDKMSVQAIDKDSVKIIEEDKTIGNQIVDEIINRLQDRTTLTLVPEIEITTLILSHKLSMISSR